MVLSVLKSYQDMRTDMDEMYDDAYEALVIWSRVPETALPPRQLYRAFICEKIVSVGRVKVLPA